MSLLKSHTVLVVVALLALAACSTRRAPSVEDRVAALGQIDFNFHVKPILSQNCFQCHGHDEESRKADLQLHTREGLYAPLRDDTARFVIVPGQPRKSELIRRITTPIAKDRMPPPESHRDLSAYDVAVLKTWVDQGASWKPHWAFIPPTRPDTPAVQRAEWPRNNLDAFILARLEREGLTPSDEADRRALIRRLSFDLTGLPPSAEDVRAFVEDARPDAYEKLVDRLLASPHFGERMAVHWLDLARYADTNGYSIDGGRHMWLWRDWVIHAFNENKPFDQFVIEQLAGDLLPDPTEAQRIATGFHRNHMITHEGGTIPEENLTNYVVDRVKTSGEVFLGLTMACAQCHDHKFDPITQRDYYRFFAYFNTISDKGLDGDRGINAVPAVEARTLLHTEEEVEQIKAEVERLRAELAQDHPGQQAWEAEQRRHLEARGRDLALHPLAMQKVTTPNTGYTGEPMPDSSVFIGEPGWLAAYNVSLKIDPDHTAAPLTGLRVEFYPHRAAQGGRIGHGRRDGMEGSFILTSITVSAGALPSDQVDLYRILPIRRITATAEHPDYPVRAALDERRINGWSPHPDNRRGHHLTLTFDEPVDPQQTPYFTVMLSFGQGDNLIAAHFRVFALTGTDDGTPIPADIQDLLTKPSERAPEEADRVQAYFAETAPATALLRHQIANLEERLGVLTEAHPTMIMDQAPEPRETFTLNRGQYDQPTERVEPGVPSVLPPLPEGAGANRLGLARWLVQTDHPLTARVAVNRFWQMLFGTGLVATAADFGAQGALPSHPDLLDWLAVEFVDGGWDVKALLKTMVMSATYRQQSATTPALLEIDPQNRLLARGPRFRLQAEFIRDAALKAGGLLVDRMGGPSVRPYQPAGLWKEVSHYGSTPATAQVFVQDHAEKLYRRSLYTYWKRTAPPPSMLTFDAPTREVCTVTREVTNTPLQALVLLNDPQFVEASRALAGRILREAEDDIESRILFAFEEVTSRTPDRQTVQRLRQRFEEEHATYQTDPDAATAYLGVGESRRDETLDLAKHAAWTTIATLILNLSETITKG